MPNRFDDVVARLQDPSMSPADRLELLASTVIRMADELKRVAEEVRKEHVDERP